MGTGIQEAFISIVPLACYVIFIFYSFCDGFKMRPARKVTWSVYFLSFSYLSFLCWGYFNLAIIVSLSSLTAFALAWFQNRDNRLREKK